MRKTLVRLTLAFIVLAVASIGPLSSIAQNSNNKAVQERKLVGFIAGQKVNLTGRVSGRTIRVTSIEAAS